MQGGRWLKELVEIGGVGCLKVRVLNLNYCHFDLLDEGGCVYFCSFALLLGTFQCCVIQKVLNVRWYTDDIMVCEVLFSTLTSSLCSPSHVVTINREIFMLTILCGITFCRKRSITIHINVN